MHNIVEYLPHRVNTGPFLTAYTLPELEQRIQSQRMVLPVCSLGTRIEQISRLAPLVLPPLYHEALEPELKSDMLRRIEECFPYYAGTQQREEFRGKLEIVELPQMRNAKPPSPRVLGLSVDTAVEQHGPHLPLSTDTIQSYSVLRQLASEIDGFVLGPPVEYGQLTWGLPLHVAPDTGDLDVGLVYEPPVAHGVTAGSGGFDELRSEPLYPTKDRDVINPDASLSEELFHVAV